MSCCSAWDFHALTGTVNVLGGFGDGSRSCRRWGNGESRPLVGAMKVWLEQELNRIPSNSSLADAIHYALARWPALCCFLTDGRVDLDTNPVERAIRPHMRPTVVRTSASIRKRRSPISWVASTTFLRAGWLLMPAVRVPAVRAGFCGPRTC